MSKKKGEQQSENNADNEVLFNFWFRLNNKQHISTFKDFRNLCCVLGKDINDVMISLFSDFTKNNNVDFTIVTQKELDEELKKRKMRVPMRHTFVKYRDSGMFYVNGKPCSFTNGKAVLYDLERTIKYIEWRQSIDGIEPVGPLNDGQE